MDLFRLLTMSEITAPTCQQDSLRHHPRHHHSMSSATSSYLAALCMVYGIVVPARHHHHHRLCHRHQHHPPPPPPPPPTTTTPIAGIVLIIKALETNTRNTRTNHCMGSCSCDNNNNNGQEQQQQRRRQGRHSGEGVGGKKGKESFVAFRQDPSIPESRTYNNICEYQPVGVALIRHSVG